MNVRILIIIEIIGLLLLALALAKAITVDNQMSVNGTIGILDSVITDENIVSVTHVTIEGIGYVRIVYQNGDERIMELEEYITQNEQSWLDKGSYGIDFYRISHWFQNIADWILGKNKSPTPDEILAGTQLARAFVTRQEYNNLLYQNYLLNLRLESLEKSVNQETLCDSRLQMAIKYNVTNFRCDNTTYIQLGNSYFGITPF